MNEIMKREGGFDIQVRTVQEAWQFSEIISKSPFAPPSFQNNPGACMLAMQFGAEIGLKPLQSLQNIAVINGRPSIWGDAALALVKSSPDFQKCAEWIEGDGEKMVALCEVQRKGEEPQVISFSVPDAKKAGLWGKKGPWSQYPKRMLQLRARGFALRDVFPHVLRGLVLSEEAQDYPSSVRISEPEAIEVKPDPKPGPDPEYMTNAQRKAIFSITQSHVFTAEEREKAVAFSQDGKKTVAQGDKFITSLKEHYKARKEAAKEQPPQVSCQYCGNTTDDPTGDCFEGDGDLWICPNCIERIAIKAEADETQE